MRFLLLLTTSLLISCTISNDKKELISSSDIAYAVPLKDIEIDGDLSDWPSELIKYKLKHLREFKSAPHRDFDGFFQIGYQKGTNDLFIAISMPADSTPIVDKNRKWNDQDSYSLYIDEQNIPFGSGVGRYTFNSEMFNGSNPDKSWDPNMNQFFDWGKLERAEITSGGRKVIEFRYKLSNPIHTGQVLGLNHVIADANTRNAYNDYYVWVDNPYSYKTSGRLGNVVILDDEVQTSEIEGAIKLEISDTTNAHFPKKIIIQNIKKPKQWVRTKVDSTGNFSAKLPIGDYKFVLDNPFIQPGERYLRLKPGSEWEQVNLDLDGISNLELSVSEVHPPDLWPEQGILEDGFSPDDAIQIDEFVKTYMSYYDIPGVSLTVFSKGEIVHSNVYGYGNQFTKKPISSNTIFEGASMTKPMFGFAVMRLVEKGLVDLDKPLYLDAEPPKDIEENEWYKLITPRMVLTHQTGLPNWANNSDDGRLYFKFKPGTGIGYSGAGFTYLTRTIENITKKSIIEIMQEEVVDVLNLKDTYFHDTGDFAHKKANGHLFNYARMQEILEYPEMASSVHTNSLEYAKFLLAISRKEGLSKETYDLMVHPTVLRSEHTEQGKLCKHYYGLGWSLRDSPFFGLSFGHSGSNGDFKCTSTYYENSGNGFVVMTNGSTGHMLQFDLHNLLNIGKVQIEP